MISPVTQANTISIAVPARDEEAYLEWSVTTMISVAERHFVDYEIFIYDDGSTDRTGEIADQLAERYERVSAFHNLPAICLGGVVREGLKRARMDFFMYIDGKGATSAEALDLIFASRSEADLVVPCPINRGERPFVRRVLSRMFVGILNTTFGLDLHYYTHLILCRTDMAREVNMRTTSYAFQAERVVKLIKSGRSYVQIGVTDRYDLPARKTKAFKLLNVLGVAAFYLWTVWDVYGGGKGVVKRSM
ncbi:MAG: glycosyltransferase family 2 protein [Kiritimatiellia bacterium]|jgi:glycosyltransferase involved in cell wall biosynthesis|nr:glycosyltransferase family 2 protein [Kiritimatiellia bacterium]